MYGVGLLVGSILLSTALDREGLGVDGAAYGLPQQSGFVRKPSGSCAVDCAASSWRSWLISLNNHDPCQTRLGLRLVTNEKRGR